MSLDMFASVSPERTTLSVIIAVVVIAVAKTVASEAGKDLYGAVKSLARRSARHRLTSENIKHCNEIRAGLKENLPLRRRRETGSVEAIITDANRGGITYGENKRFLRFKKWMFQRVYILDYYDKEFLVGYGMAVGVKRDKNKWVETTESGNHVRTAYKAALLSYDNVAAIDWESSKSDNTPTIYYYMPFAKMFEKEIYVQFDEDGNFAEL